MKWVLEDLFQVRFQVLPFKTLIMYTKLLWKPNELIRLKRTAKTENSTNVFFHSPFWKNEKNLYCETMLLLSPYWLYKNNERIQIWSNFIDHLQFSSGLASTDTSQNQIWFSDIFLEVRFSDLHVPSLLDYDCLWSPPRIQFFTHCAMCSYLLHIIIWLFNVMLHDNNGQFLLCSTFYVLNNMYFIDVMSMSLWRQINSIL